MNKKGPFGLWMGMSLADLTDLGCETNEVAPAKYLVTKVPKPHSAFKYYILQITPNNGLSWIKAIGNTIDTSVFGVDLKSEFVKMEEKLVNAYGKADRTDILLHGSIWNEPRDWMQSILHKERFLMSEWSIDKGSNLPDSLTSIGLLTNADDTNSGSIAVEYYFQNISSSESEIATVEDDVL